MKTILSALIIFCTMGLYAQEGQTLEPTCQMPYRVTYGDINMRNAVIHWGIFSGPPPESYILKYMDAMVSPSKWRTIENITDTTYTLTGLKPNHGYSVKVAAVCSNGVISKYGPNQSGLSINTEAKGNYCWAYGNGLNYIEGMRLNGVNYSTGDNGGYGDYVSTIIPLEAGHIYKMYLKGHIWSNNNPDCQFRAYIDYNQNKTFEEDEYVGNVYTTKSDSVVQFNFKVPVSAQNGETRLRLVFEETFFASDSPCNYNANGETEDYTVNISGGSLQANPINDNASENMQSVKLQISPNPASNGLITLQYNLVQKGSVQISIRDYMGTSTQLINKGFIDKGTYTEKLQVQNLMPGIYQVTLLQNGAIIQQQKLVVVY
ncbi:MAG: fibronectin type III domain-containing protein [Bacteroidetes bacterium]|nr:fibronectin type III domain-containing protein [Bacteroidota bacterium]